MIRVLAALHRRVGVWAAVLATVVAPATVSPQAAEAHPHMFFDAQAQFVVDDDGRLTKVRVAFVVDEFNSLYTLAELGLDLDGDGALTASERASLGQAMMTGLSGYGYFVDLSLDDRKAMFGAPRDVAATLQDGRVAARFDLPLSAPRPLAGAAVSLALYDPTYFTAVDTAAPAAIVGGEPEGCAIDHQTFESTSQLAHVQTLLAKLSREETPEEQNVGVLFADKTRLTCDG